MVFFIKQSEISQSDHLHEMLDRLRFLCSRLELIETALGGEYQYGSTTDLIEPYTDYQTPLIDQAVPHDEPTVVASYADQQVYTSPHFTCISYDIALAKCVEAPFLDRASADAYYATLIDDTKFIIGITNGELVRVIE